MSGLFWACTSCGKTNKFGWLRCIECRAKKPIGK